MKKQHTVVHLQNFPSQIQGSHNQIINQSPKHHYYFEIQHFKIHMAFPLNEFVVWRQFNV